MNAGRTTLPRAEIVALSAVIATLMLLFTGLTPARAEGPKAALLLTMTKGVTQEKLAAFWPATMSVIGQYYTLLPEADVWAAQKTAQEAGCENEACLDAVRKALGVPIALQLLHTDEGYFNPLKMWKATDAGVEKHDYMCSRCTFQEFKVVLNRLTKKFEAEH